MRVRRKRSNCLNCGISLTETDNYCAYCGQENTDSNVRFSTLIGDFFNNYISFDSKIFRSVMPFLVKPGYLTNQYNIGRRNSFVHPLRLYFVISLFYFFVLSLILNSEVSDDSFSFQTINQEGEAAFISDSVLIPIEKEMDSLSIPNVEEVKTVKTYNKDWVGKINMLKNPAYTDEMVMDSLNIEPKTEYSEFFVHQGRKVLKGDIKPFMMYAVKNFPIMMFLALPLFALLLKLLYLRRKKLYVMHLIHTLHLHSFAYVLYGLTLLIYYYLFPNDNLLTFSFLFVSIYTYLSFLKVYNQSKKKTAAKFFLAGYLYLICLCTLFTVELLISFFLF